MAHAHGRRKHASRIGGKSFSGTQAHIEYDVSSFLAPCLTALANESQQEPRRVATRVNVFLPSTGSPSAMVGVHIRRLRLVALSYCLVRCRGDPCTSGAEIALVLLRGVLSSRLSHAVSAARPEGRLGIDASNLRDRIHFGAYAQEVCKEFWGGGG